MAINKMLINNIGNRLGGNKKYENRKVPPKNKV